MDAVFRDEVDQTTYSLYVGCGGCVASADPIVIPPVALDGYQPAVIEPFTQTRYSSVFPRAKRKYNASGIHPSVCDQGHFTIRLVDHANRTGAHAGPVVWSAVIGLAESFTFEELMLFPAFVLRNHGDTWNEQGWTIWVVVFVLTPALILTWRWLVLSRRPSETLGYLMSSNPRVVLYELATFAFIATMLEEFIHLNIAAQGAQADGAYWVGLVFVILLANGLPLWQVWTAWSTIDYVRPAGESTFSSSYWACASSPVWAPFELLFGFSYFLLFGAGFYVGPALICLAALVRMWRLSRAPSAPSAGSAGGARWEPVAAVAAARAPPLYLRAATRC